MKERPILMNGAMVRATIDGSKTHAKLFKHLWNSTGGKWEANPWVWVIEFRRIK